jgi:hypothetical protein
MIANSTVQCRLVEAVPVRPVAAALHRLGMHPRRTTRPDTFWRARGRAGAAENDAEGALLVLLARLLSDDETATLLHLIGRRDAEGS